ncbi:putative G antigen family E member 3 [Chlorocebus sabaeus]|uniref:putative G antigen family E member 3 n=1 Tax=Chlorocebus sabaeus TaxID=60711 RepID=UPI003BF98E8E
MSERVRTRSQSSERGNEQESSQPVESVIVQQPTEEKRQEEEAPTENQGIAPSGEIENEGAPAVQGPDVEAFQQALALLKIEDEPGDGPDVREETLPTFDPTKVLEAGSSDPCWLPHTLSEIEGQVMRNHRFTPRQMKTETKNVIVTLEI